MAKARVSKRGAKKDKVVTKKTRGPKKAMRSKTRETSPEVAWKPTGYTSNLFLKRNKLKKLNAFLNKVPHKKIRLPPDLTDRKIIKQIPYVNMWDCDEPGTNAPQQRLRKRKPIELIEISDSDSDADQEDDDRSTEIPAKQKKTEKPRPKIVTSAYKKQSLKGKGILNLSRDSEGYPDDSVPLKKRKMSQLNDSADSTFSTSIGGTKVKKRVSFQLDLPASTPVATKAAKKLIYGDFKMVCDKNVNSCSSSDESSGDDYIPNVSVRKKGKKPSDAAAIEADLKKKKKGLPFKFRFTNKFKYKDHSCDMCQKYFSKNVDLQYHVLRHVQPKKLSVKLYKHSLPEHFVTTNEENKYLKSHRVQRDGTPVTGEGELSSGKNLKGLEDEASSGDNATGLVCDDGKSDSGVSCELKNSEKMDVTSVVDVVQPEEADLAERSDDGIHSEVLETVGDDTDKSDVKEKPSVVDVVQPEEADLAGKSDDGVHSEVPETVGDDTDKSDVEEKPSDGNEDSMKENCDTDPVSELDNMADDLSTVALYSSSSDHNLSDEITEKNCSISKEPELKNLLDEPKDLEVNGDLNDSQSTNLELCNTNVESDSPGLNGNREQPNGTSDTENEAAIDDEPTVNAITVIENVKIKSKTKIDDETAETQSVNDAESIKSKSDSDDSLFNADTEPLSEPKTSPGSISDGELNTATKFDLVETSRDSGEENIYDDLSDEFEVDQDEPSKQQPVGNGEVLGKTIEEIVEQLDCEEGSPKAALKNSDEDPNSGNKTVKEDCVKSGETYVVTDETD